MKQNFFNTQTLYKNYSPHRNSKSELRTSSKHKPQTLKVHKDPRLYRSKHEPGGKDSYVKTSRPKTKKDSKNSGLFDFIKSTTSDNNIPKHSLKTSSKLMPPLSMPRSISPNVSNRKRSISNIKHQEILIDIKEALKHYKGKTTALTNQKITAFCIFDSLKPSKFYIKFKKNLQPGLCQKCKKELKKEGFEFQSIPEEFVYIKKPDSPEKQKYYDLIEIQKKKIISLRNERIKKISENKTLVIRYKKRIENFFFNLQQILDTKKTQIIEQFELSCLKINNYYDLVENLINRNIQDLIKLQQSLRKSKETENDKIEKGISYHSELATTYQFQQVQDPLSIKKNKFIHEFQNHFDGLWETCYEKPINSDNILQQLEQNFQMCPPNESQLQDEIQYKNQLEQEKIQQSTSKMQPLVDYILNDKKQEQEKLVFKDTQEDSIISSIYDQSQNQSLADYQTQFKKIQEEKIKRQIEAQNLGNNFQRKKKKQEENIIEDQPDDSLLQMYEIIPDAK